ncbi:MAG: hypothetical protein JW957_01740 [Candidatus Omnitrophica bacterium]|nr:hypothetical protein [Candidatus Omnitrophota bacterium]
MYNKYRHTQTGWLIIYIFAALIFISLFLLKNLSPDMLLFTFIMAVTLSLFYNLTVTMDEECLKIRFGIGLIRKRFPLKDIASCRRVRNSWYYGWGIHLTPHGWLYNVSGFDAVEVVTKAGKKYRIGTDVPAELEHAVHCATHYFR